MLPLSTKDPVQFAPAEERLKAAGDRVAKHQKLVDDLELEVADLAKHAASENGEAAELVDLEIARERLAAARGQLAAAIELEAAARTVRDAFDGRPPAYRVRVPTFRDRIELRREVAAAGARNPDDGEIMRALRRAAEAAGAADVVEAIDAALPDIDAGRGIPAELVQVLASAEDVIGRNDAAWRELLAARSHFEEIMQYFLVRNFLLGWQNLEAPFRRTGGAVDDATIEAIPRLDYPLIARKVASLLQVSAAQAKNCGPRAPAPGGRETLPADPRRRTAGRAGLCSASCIRPIRACYSTTRQPKCCGCSGFTVEKWGRSCQRRAASWINPRPCSTLSRSCGAPSSSSRATNANWRLGR